MCSFRLFFGATVLLLSSASALNLCTSDACSSQIRALPTHSAFCHGYELNFFHPPALPTAIKSCDAEPLRILSACLCVGLPTTSSTTHRTTSTSTSTTHRSTTTTTPTTLSTHTTTSSTTSHGMTTSTTTTTTTSTTATSTTTTSTTTTPVTITTPPSPSVTAPAGPIYNVVGNGNFRYDASAPGGLAFWTILGNALLVSGNAYHGDGNTGNYAVQLITAGASSGRRRVRRQTSNMGATGIEQILSDLDQTSQYTVSLWYYVDYTSALNAAPQNCRIDAYYGSTLYGSTPYFATNTGQSSQWVQFISTFTPSTASGNLEFLLDCINSGTAEVLVDEVFVSNQVTPGDIDNISLTYALAPTTSTTSSPQAPSSVASTSIVPPNPTCTVHIISPFPAGSSCQKEVATTGSPDELYIYGNAGIALVDCAAACLANPACESMSYGPISGAGQCILYPRSVASEGFSASSSSGLYVWDTSCWTYLGSNGAACVAASSTTSTQIIPTPPSSSTTSSSTGCSTTYPYPAATCTDLLPNPSPAATAVCGIAGAGANANVYQGNFVSSAACQLGCVQSATCKSWAYLTICQFSDEEFLTTNEGTVWVPGQGSNELWFDNECFYCAGSLPGSSCATTTSTAPTSTSTSSTTCPTQLVVNPSFETYSSTDSAAPPWNFASFSSLQSSGTVQAAVDGAMFAELNPGFVLYNYGPYGQPTSASFTQSISCFDPTQTYTVDFYWYVHNFLQSTAAGITTTTCSVYVQIAGTTVFTTTFNGPSDIQLSTWDYTHTTANFVPPSATATLLVGADCLGDEGFINVDLITIYPASGSSGLSPNYEYPSPS